jgi:uncharacterized protein (DUF736 family)
MSHVHDADTLARVLFIESTHATAMVLPFIDGAKELFFVLLDLFARGVVLLFCTGDRKTMPIHEISTEQFEEVSGKMRRVGVKCWLAVEPTDDESGTNINDIRGYPPGLDIGDYRVAVVTRGNRYTMWFTIERPTSGDMRCTGNIRTR